MIWYSMEAQVFIFYKFAQSNTYAKTTSRNNLGNYQLDKHRNYPLFWKI